MSDETVFNDNEMEEQQEGFFDSVGGFHRDGIGYSPNGEWCGECSRNSCESCVIYTRDA